MKKIDLGQAFSLLANIGVIAGIVLLAYELRQNTQATQLESAQSFLSATASLDLLIAQDPEISRILSSEMRDLTNVDQLRAERFRYSAMRQWENAYYLYSISALDEDFWLAYRNEISNVISGSDRFRSFWEARRSSFTPVFNEEFANILSGTQD